MSFSVGENVGQYRIVEQLGQGGMATVFKAYHASLDRYVAIKALHPVFHQDVAFESRFQREARVVAKLEHPNIVPVYDYAEHDKRPYLVMKFIEGITLKARMEQGPLSADEIIKVMDAVGAALAYAHRQGVLHRDIKPSNVLLSNDGKVYLADFGLARMAQAGESTLSSDSVMGTPQYISPEQAMGKSDLDQRTDLYSLGVMLYEVVVGKVPFSADTPFAIIHDHIYTPLPLPRKVNPNVSDAVERVLLKALAKDRDDRFEDASLLVSAFKSAWGDVNMSNVSASQVLRSEAGTFVQSQTSVTETNAQGVKQVDDDIAVSISKKKRGVWVWVSAAVVIFLCIIFFAYARNHHLFARILARPATVPPPPATQSMPGNNPPPVAGGAEPAQPAQPLPSDPDEQLDQALSYWDDNMNRQAFETLSALQQNAEADADFFADAGDEFYLREAWLPSAMMYARAMELYGKDNAPREVNDVFREVLYRSAERPEAPALLQFDDIARFDEPLALIVKARNALYNDRIEDARTFLDQARKIIPDMPEAILLDAEFNMKDGKMPQARKTLEDLKKSNRVPEWITQFANELLTRMPR